MATGYITKRAVDALKPERKQSFLWDAGDGALKGFGVRITPSGVKSYVYQYRLGGRAARVRRYTIGRHGEFTPEKARARAAELAEQVRRKIDPIDAEAGALSERMNKAKASQELAFDVYADRFLKMYVQPYTPNSYGFSEAILRLHVSPSLKAKPLPEITRRDISALLDKIDAAKPSVRRNCFAVMRKLFNWARARGDLDQSPLAGMEQPPTVPSRDRVLSDEELALTFRAAQDTGYPFGPMFELLFATGQRRDEVAKLDWNELDRQDSVWILPKERTKNSEANIIPLNRLALAALDRAASNLRDFDGAWPKSGLVFTTTGKTPVSGYSKAKAQLDARIAELAGKDVNMYPKMHLEPVKHWRLHDARRTLATGLQRLGVRFEVTEAVLNHISGSRSGIAGVYQRHGWKSEKRAALDAWSAHIERLLHPAERTNVVTLSPSNKKPIVG